MNLDQLQAYLSTDVESLATALDELSIELKDSYTQSEAAALMNHLSPDRVLTASEPQSTPQAAPQPAPTQESEPVDNGEGLSPMKARQGLMQLKNYHSAATNQGVQIVEAMADRFNEVGEDVGESAIPMFREAFNAGLIKGFSKGISENNDFSLDVDLLPGKPEIKLRRYGLNAQSQRFLEAQTMEDALLLSPSEKSA